MEEKNVHDHNIVNIPLNRLKETSYEYFPNIIPISLTLHQTINFSCYTALKVHLSSNSTETNKFRCQTGIESKESFQF